MPKQWVYRPSLVLALILSQVLYLSSLFQSREKPLPSSSLIEEQKIVHFLNRAGFGPRPGDVERVRRIGLPNYIESQLHPAKIEDTAAEAKLAGFKTLTMRSADLMEAYPAR